MVFVVSEEIQSSDVYKALKFIFTSNQDSFLVPTFESLVLQIYEGQLTMVDVELLNKKLSEIGLSYEDVIQIIGYKGSIVASKYNLVVAIDAPLSTDLVIRRQEITEFFGGLECTIFEHLLGDHSEGFSESEVFELIKDLQDTYHLKTTLKGYFSGKRDILMSNMEKSHSDQLKRDFIHHLQKLRLSVINRLEHSTGCVGKNLRIGSEEHKIAMTLRPVFDGMRNFVVYQMNKSEMEETVYQEFRRLLLPECRLNE